MMAFWLRTSALIAVAACAIPCNGSPSDRITVVGSSTVYPFSVIVADHFAKSGPFKPPSVISSSTDEGIMAFCAGDAAESPDIATASRRMRNDERAACAAGGIKRITEIEIGYDSLLLVGIAGGPAFNVTLDQFWRAIAKFVPVNGFWVPNPYRTWRDIAPSLPDQPIILLGPGPGHGTREALISLVMEPSCTASLVGMPLLTPVQRERICGEIREDGRWTNVENLELILGKIASNPLSMGVMTYAFLEQFSHRIRAATINGVAPTQDNISAAKYPLSRALYIYVNEDHLPTTAGLADFAGEFLSSCATGANGYLLDEGLVPLRGPELLRQRKILARLQR